jgi:hypothetical protein
MCYSVLPCTAHRKSVRGLVTPPGGRRQDDQPVASGVPGSATRGSRVRRRLADTEARQLMRRHEDFTRR